MAITIPSVAIDPVSGLVDYVLEVKPYHTKILEVLVEYIHTDCIDITIEEAFYLSLGQPHESILGLWGWDVEEAQKWFNGGYIFHQIADVDIPGKVWSVVGDKTAYFANGDEILIQTDSGITSKYTVTNVAAVTVSKTLNSMTDVGSPQSASPICQGSQETYSLDPNTSCSQISQDYTVTQITVAEVIPPSATSKGVIVPANAWHQNPETGVYQYKVGIAWPSTTHVEKNQDCAGYGYEFQDSFDWQSNESYLAGEQVQYQGYVYEAAIDLPAGSPATNVPGGSPDVWILLGRSIQTDVQIKRIIATNAFVIDNNTNTPYSFADWRAVFSYGVKFNISFENPLEYNQWDYDREYTVLFTTLDTSTQELTIYTIEQIVITPAGSPTQLASPLESTVFLQGSPTGIINVRPFGYDEPALCQKQGQSLIAQAHITETLVFDWNLEDTIIANWDVDLEAVGWDLEGFDTYVNVFE